MPTQDATEITALKERIPKRIRLVESLLRNVRDKYRLGRCWVRLLNFDARAGLKDLIDLVVTNQFFRAEQVPSELAALGEILLDLRLKTAAEIGTWRGGTLFFVTRLACPGAKIVSIDLPGGQFGGGYGSGRAWLYRRFARRGQRLFTLRGDSHSNEMVERLRAVLGSELLDYLFIDGDHTYLGVKQDFDLYSPLVRPGGLIAFHDIVDHPPEMGCEVSRFWNEIKTGYRYKEIVANPNQGRAGIGVLFVD